MSHNAQKILSYLFAEAGSVAFNDIAKYFSVDKSIVESCVDEIISWATTTPFTIIKTENDIALVLNDEMSEVLAELDKKDGERELTKASLETLSVILYKGGATRSEIDYIRGVNSAFSIRSLTNRAYIERGPKNTYVPTADLLMFLGVTSLDQLPEKGDIEKKLNEINIQNDDTN